MTATLNGHQFDVDELRTRLDEPGTQNTPTPLTSDVPDEITFTWWQQRAHDRRIRRQLVTASKTRHQTQMDSLRVHQERTGDDRMLRRAQRRRQQMFNDDARLTNAMQTLVTLARILISVAAAGVAVNAIQVALSVGGPNPKPWLYFVEPIFSVPLLTIVWAGVKAAQFGHSRMLARVPAVNLPFGRAIRLPHIKVIFLLAALAINVIPVLTAAAFDPELLVMRAGPPILIVLAVLIVGPITETFESILGAQHAPGAGSPRLSDEDNEFVWRLRRVVAAVRHGYIEVQDNGCPSASAIARFLRPIGKQQAQGIRDAYLEAFGPASEGDPA